MEEFAPEISRRTAIARKTPSVPLRWLLQKGLINPQQRILDYGCGRGVDVEYLRSQGFKEVQGYDPYQPAWDDPRVLKIKYYDVVLNFYVLNVLPPKYRSSVLQNIWRVLKDGGTAYIAVRDVTESGFQRLSKELPRGWQRYEDGYITSRGTFQTWYTPEKLLEEIKSVWLFRKIEIINKRHPLIARAVS